MPSEVTDAHDELLAKARDVVDELESVDPEQLATEDWESELEPYNRAVDEFENQQTEFFELIIGESSGKGRIRSYLRSKVGEPVRTQTLARISGISEYARRVRELRNEEGFVIDSTRTRSELGNDDYFVVEIQEVDEKSRISAKARFEQLEREESCQVCGRDIDHPDVRYMEVDHIESFVDDDDADAVNDPANLRTLCNQCHHGKSASDGIANRRQGGS